jgi:hypothetical protein
MQMDGYEILPGDAVFDLIYGTGFVHRIDAPQDVFYVRFGNRSLGYRPSGVTDRTARRTLFWQDPMVFVPAKNAEVWLLALASFRALWAVLSRSPLVETVAHEHQDRRHGP